MMRTACVVMIVGGMTLLACIDLSKGDYKIGIAAVLLAAANGLLLS